MKKIYLACPYSHPDHKIRSIRVSIANRYAGYVMQLGFCVFSPLSHSHPIAETMEIDNCDHDFWLKQDLPFLTDWADQMWIMELDGWRESRGIDVELKKAMELGIPINRVHKSDIIKAILPLGMGR